MDMCIFQVGIFEIYRSSLQYAKSFSHIVLAVTHMDETVLFLFLL